ncbi:MAG: hypothetical protein R3C58_15240 [Parvularculaceae bacterium]
MDDLQIVIRTYRKTYGGTLEDFATKAAHRLKGAGAKKQKGAGKKSKSENGAPDPAVATIEGFLKTASSGEIQKYVAVCLAELAERVKKSRPSDKDSYLKFIADFEAGGDYRNDDDVRRLLDDNRHRLTTGRREKAAKRSTRNPVELKKVLGRMYLLSAHMLERNQTDVSPEDQRIGNSRYVGIRAHSWKPDHFVVHGFRFAPFNPDARRRRGEPALTEDDNRFTDIQYFSDKFFLRRSADGGEYGRTSRGAYCVEGNYISGIARAPDLPVAPFTYLHVKLPPYHAEGDASLSTLEAVISSANTNNERFWAHALCFRCKDKDEKHTKTGIYLYDDLLKMFDARQSALIEDWRKSGKFTLMKL